MTPTIPTAPAIRRRRFASRLSSGMRGDIINHSKKSRTASQNSQATEKWIKTVVVASTTLEKTPEVLICQWMKGASSPTTTMTETGRVNRQERAPVRVSGSARDSQLWRRRSRSAAISAINIVAITFQIGVSSQRFHKLLGIANTTTDGINGPVSWGIAVFQLVIPRRERSGRLSTVR